jgi:hypothetical protein
LPFMTSLNKFQWWPKYWLAQAGSNPTTAEISKHGTLTNVQMLDGSLRLVVDYMGTSCTGTISPGLSKDALILLRHILLQHYGERMEIVEQIDIDF